MTEPPTPTPPPEPPPTPPEPPPPEPTPEPDVPDDQLSDREQRYKREAIARRRETRAAQAEADKMRVELERLRGEHESETDKRVREAVEQAKTETAAQYERRLLEATVATKAAGRLAHPEVAAALLPLDELLDERDEATRAQRLDDALDELLERMPELGTNGATSPSSSLITQGVRTPPKAGAASDDPDAWIRARAKQR